VYGLIAPSQGAVDAEFAAAAAQSGYIGVTFDKALVNFVQQTLQRGDIPLRLLLK
jgi:hypothetical protein